MKVCKYENLHIGNFLISTGYYIRVLEGKLPLSSESTQASISLYQQSGKADYTIRDLFGALGGKCFIIEFKRDKKLIGEEMKKPQRLKLIEKLNDNEYQDLINVSSRAHLLCYPTYEEESMNYNFEPYATSFEIVKHTEYNILGVSNFVNSLIVSNDIGVSFGDMRAYIELLKICANNPTFSSSGAIFSYSKKSGFTYVEYSDLNVLEYKLKMEQGISKELKQSQNKGNINNISM